MSDTKPYFICFNAKKQSGEKNAVFWESAKNDNRALRDAENALEDAGKDRNGYFAKAIITGLPVFNDLPEEGEIDFTWCDRYQLCANNTAWELIPGVSLPSASADTTSTSQADAAIPATAETTAPANEGTVLVENRSRGVRFAIHLLNDKYQIRISQDLHMHASTVLLDEENAYLKTLLLASNDVPELEELSVHAEWKLVQAVKDVFPQDADHEAALLAQFMSAWIKAEDHNQLVDDWKSGRLPEQADGERLSSEAVCDALQELRQRDLPVLTVTATLPLRQCLLAQYISENEYAYHIDEEQKKTIQKLELDVDNSYVQNLILAAENVEPFKKAKPHDIWKVINGLKTIFPVEGKRAELSAFIQFFKTWFSTEHIDRSLLVKEWAKGNRVSAINRTLSGANAGGGIHSDRRAPQTKIGLEYEIALGLIARKREFDIYNPPIEVDTLANAMLNRLDDLEFVATRELFTTMPGGFDFSRACNIATVKTTPEELWKSPFRHREYLNKVMTETDHAHPDQLIIDIACGNSSLPMPMAGADEEEQPSREELDRQLAAGRGEFVPGISDPQDPKWEKTPRKSFCTHEENLQRVREEGARRRAEEAAQQSDKDDHSAVNEETTSDVQVQNDNGHEESAGNALPPGEDTMQPGESNAGAGEEATSVEQQSAAEILAASAPSLANQDQDDVNQNSDSVIQNSDSVNHSAPEVQQNAPEVQQDEPEQTWSTYFEPGRYEGLPNDVYHAANGISSTMVKDARVSLMYYERRHVSKTIIKERSKVLDMGNLVHALALQPEILDEEFSIEPIIPEGALTTTATIRAVIDDYNNSLPVLLSADDIKRFLEEYNATLPPQLPLGASADETYSSYEQLPEEFQRIENGTKHTAATMKACIKEYNATLPAQVKTSGSRDALLEQLAIINPDLVAQEAQKPAPLKVSGTKADLIQSVKTVKPDAVFADEILDAWRENPDEKILVTRQQYETALAIQSALYAHPEAGKLLQNPTRAVEVSYFGIDEETGLEIRTRPDVEIVYEGLRIGFDLKTISMWDVKENQLKSRLHREITMRDYHLSAGMYCENASLDKFAWIFVNKDEGYHWVAVVWASSALMELGTLEYHQTMRAIANAMDTGEWPAPITEDYTDELNDFDLRRLDTLREMA